MREFHTCHVFCSYVLSYKILLLVNENTIVLSYKILLLFNNNTNVYIRKQVDERMNAKWLIQDK